MYRVVIGFLFCLNALFAVNADPSHLELQQPDGAMFTAYQRGDEWQNWFENETGYTILKNED